jgi:hypothetical protein
MKKLLMCFVLGVLLISMASASLGTFKQNECVGLKTILNSTWVNVSTISYPDGSIEILNDAMEKNALTFNYTFCSTSQIGEYLYDYYDNEGYVYVNDFDVTASGSESNSSLFWLIIILSIGFILIGLWREDYAITTLGTFAMGFVGLHLLYYGLDSMKNDMTNALAIVFLSVTAYIAIKMGLDFLRYVYD